MQPPTNITQLNAFVALVRTLVPFQLGPHWHRYLTVAGVAVSMALAAFGAPGVLDGIPIGAATLGKVIEGLTLALQGIRIAETWPEVVTPVAPAVASTATSTT